MRRKADRVSRRFVVNKKKYGCGRDCLAYDLNGKGDALAITPEIQVTGGRLGGF